MVKNDTIKNKMVIWKSKFKHREIRDWRNNIDRSQKCNQKVWKYDCRG